MIDGPPWAVADVPFHAPPLERDVSTDVLVVGAGAAGVLTAEAVLRRTSLRCVVVERGTVGTGATGHSAGHLATGFEIGYAELARRRGPAAAVRAHDAFAEGRRALHAVIDTWGIQCGFQEVPTGVAYARARDLLDDLATDTALFPGDLRGARYAANGISGLSTSASPALVTPLHPEDYRGTLLMRFPHVGVRMGAPTTLTNPRALTRLLAGALRARFPARIAVHEHSALHGFTDYEGGYECRVGTHRVRARSVVFASNGNPPAPTPPTLSSSIAPSVHCMLGFVVEDGLVPHAFGWYSADPHHDFYYGNVRPWSDGRLLLVLGGPDHLWLEGATSRDVAAFRASSHARLLAFAWKTGLVNARTAPDFGWHGTLGYTRDGVRLICRDPRHPGIYHNSGCNGIGLLLSAYGAQQIASLLNGGQGENLFEGSHA
ncbi:FAD-binding oxidoreductase [Longimicrobium sp.]|uniref:NAD(P)/FAD-dependent oxidoreductase n=1 Tax=Longimicrobium sp. TaxID=2029185 RepID=UPI002E2F7EA2|nr:FAD-binding oxidoreductase [Longimicrobium sp.]HEX6040936.1 FAD-binding oxidoreductase [Longimicrobium sp.]